MKKIRILLLFIISCLLFSCSTATMNPTESQFVIGISQIGDDAWFQKMDLEMKQQALFHPQIKLVFCNGHYDLDLQRRQIDSLIAQKVDLLIVGPTDERSICDASNRAYDAGIPVVMTSHYGIGEKYTAFVCMSNYEIGQSLAAFLVKVAHREQCTIRQPLQTLFLEGPQDILPTKLRSKGMMDGLSGHPEIRIVARGGAEWRRKDATTITDSLLFVYPNIQAIVAQNDEMAIGASNACAAHNVLDKVHIMGVDAMVGKDAGIEAILRGEIEESVMSTTRGDLVIKTAVAILTGQPYEKETYLPVVSVNETSPQLMLRMAEEMNSSQDAIATLQTRVNHLWTVSGSQRVTITVLVLIVILVVAAMLGIHNIQKNRRKVREQLIKLDALTQELARTNESKSYRAQFMGNIQAYIENHLSDTDLSVEQIQKNLGVSRTQLFRLTKETMGTTPIELIRHIRLHRAQQMLQQTDMTIQEVAYSVGFSSPSYFSKCYKEKFGQNPSKK